jgi:hypothetical protein
MVSCHIHVEAKQDITKYITNNQTHCDLSYTVTVITLMFTHLHTRYWIVMSYWTNDTVLELKTVEVLLE